MLAIETKRLTKRYGSARGVEGIDLAVAEGEVFGFIGPNGAGKSTTIRMLLGLIFPTSGEARVFGKDAVAQSKEARRLIGYLPSEVHYYDDMKVAELLTYSQRFYGKLDRARMLALAERLQLDLDRNIEDLSFGNRKKVGIVQALLHEPKLLVLDEPTGGLDPLMQNVFFELLAEERRKGATIFFSSHILSEVQRMCDRVAILKEGRLIQVESVENLTKNNFKKVAVSFAAPPSAPLELQGIFKQESHGNGVHLLYKGDIAALVRALGDLPLTDVRIEEPSLEEIFMHYYEK
ncbi:ABC transporter ATP-binding protein [Paenibacillus sp.]|uniref:ABC transporter ATP-binding protein n=1 Tax=Paenibacillus sp. TaxID=58172 RepID=UPI002D2F6F31|nr:ABC transporter ATP-binding protein [Paenibacillus sp.]HZG55413.1 ABC transporter ATP-binding protein [Paenibacillus sp.]